MEKYKAPDGDPEMYNRYKEKLRLANLANSEAKKQFEQNLALNVKKNSKSFYSYVNSKRAVKNKIGPIKDSTGNVVTDDDLCANIINEYFSSVFTSENTSNIPDPVRVFNGTDSDALNLILITPEMVESKLAQWNVNKSPGSDGLHPKFYLRLEK